MLSKQKQNVRAHRDSPTKECEVVARGEYVHYGAPYEGRAGRAGEKPRFSGTGGAVKMLLKEQGVLGTFLGACSRVNHVHEHISA